MYIRRLRKPSLRNQSSKLLQSSPFNTIEAMAEGLDPFLDSAPEAGKAGSNMITVANMHLLHSEFCRVLGRFAGRAFAAKAKNVLVS
jgi:hypothetical protein